MDNHELGKAAESYAVSYLKSIGYKILKQNYRYLKAEVDIIAQVENTLVIVEVKARSSIVFGDPESFVNKKKISLLVMAADHFIQEQALDVSVRFDIIALLCKNGKWVVNHIEEAFYAFDGG